MEHIPKLYKNHQQTTHNSRQDIEALLRDIYGLRGKTQPQYSEESFLKKLETIKHAIFKPPLMSRWNKIDTLHKSAQQEVD